MLGSCAWLLADGAGFQHTRMSKVVSLVKQYTAIALTSDARFDLRFEHLCRKVTTSFQAALDPAATVADTSTSSALLPRHLEAH